MKWTVHTLSEFELGRPVLLPASLTVSFLLHPDQYFNVIAVAKKLKPPSLNIILNFTKIFTIKDKCYSSV